MWEQIVDFRGCGSLDHSPWLVSFKYGCEGVSLMGLSAADASEAFTTALTFPRERSQLANISPGKGFELSSAKRQVLLKEEIGSLSCRCPRHILKN